MTQALDVGTSGFVSTNRASKEATKDKYLNLGVTLMVMGGLAMIYLAARVYQQMFAWSAGMDSTNPLFDTYWMTLLYTELTVLAIAAVAVWSYLWFTRDRHLDKIEPKTELKRTSIWLRGSFAMCLPCILPPASSAKRTRFGTKWWCATPASRPATSSCSI